MRRIALSLVYLIVCFTVTKALPQRAVLDFDGDNKTDYVVLREFCDGASWYWFMQKSTEGLKSLSYGTRSSDRLIPGDYDGDGKWDIAIWRTGGGLSYFFILQSTTNTTRVLQWGVNGDKVFLTQDFDGDGKADPTVTRLVGSSLTWYINQSHDGIRVVSFGGTPDVGVRGDFDGDGKADLAVYRNNGNLPAVFIVQRSSDSGVQAMTFGNLNTDDPMPADFDGDGKTDYAVYRKNSQGADNFNWYWVQSTDGSVHSLHFGQANDIESVGDYDGDGKADQTVYRFGFTAYFYINSSASGLIAFPFGSSPFEAAIDEPISVFFNARYQ
jgi:hypothetical protein